MLSRRNFLLAISASLSHGFLPNESQILKAVPQAESLFGKVKITDVKTTTVMIRYPAHLVRIETDKGVYGIGEAFNRHGILDHIHAMKTLIIDQDPLQVDYLFQRMLEAGLGRGSLMGSLTSAISGIEIALWDLAGKILNVPVYVLLGGKFRDKILVYYDAGSPNTPDPAAWTDMARRAIDEFGFRAIKFDLDWESRGRQLAGRPYKYRQEIWNRSISSVEMKQWVRILEALRQELGEHFPLAADMHYNYNVRDAMRFIQMIDHLNLWFIEDPTPPLNADAIKRITDACRTPICTGENLYTRATWKEFIEKQACDIINPDPQKVGGLLETKKLADWADLYYITMACHNMCTPVGTYANAHACAAIRSFVAFESDSVELPHWQDIILHDGPIYKDGYLELPNKPGLGIELNEEVCKRHLAPGSKFFN